MRYILALLACLGLLIAHGMLGELLGWRHGGGLIPILILVAALTATWRAITKRRARENGDSSGDPSRTPHQCASETALSEGTSPPAESHIDSIPAQTATAQGTDPDNNTSPSAVIHSTELVSHEGAENGVFNLAMALPLVGAIGSLVGMFEMPDDYYKILRFLVVGGCAALIMAAHRSSLREPHRTGVFLLFGLLATLFNPILPLELEHTSWVWLNGVASLLLLGGIVWQLRRSAFLRTHMRTIGAVFVALSAVSLFVFGAPPLVRWLNYQTQLAEWNREADKSQFHQFKLGFNQPDYLKHIFRGCDEWEVKCVWNGGFLEWVSSGEISLSNYVKDYTANDAIQRRIFGEELSEEETFDRLRRAVNSTTNGNITLRNCSFDVASLVAFPKGVYPDEPEFSSERQKAVLQIDGSSF